MIRTLVGNRVVDHSDVVGASPVYYIFILDLTPGFNGLGKDSWKTRLELFVFWCLVQLILEILRYKQIVIWFEMYAKYCPFCSGISV